MQYGIHHEIVLGASSYYSLLSSPQLGNKVDGHPTSPMNTRTKGSNRAVAHFSALALGRSRKNHSYPFRSIILLSLSHQYLNLKPSIKPLIKPLRSCFLDTPSSDSPSQGIWMYPTTGRLASSISTGFLMINRPILDK